VSYAYQLEAERAALAEYNAASRGLELARIKRRLAELKDQHEPLDGKSDGCQRTRELMYAAAFYVVVGRWPEGAK
jgi:hypothetical protein